MSEERPDFWIEVFGMTFDQVCDLSKATDNSYLTGTGQRLVNVHEETDDCRLNGCVIHNPSEHYMDDLPTHFREDRGLMERVCPHGIGHPDPDSAMFLERTYGGSHAAFVHGCDGCCSAAARVRRDEGDDSVEIPW